jgi:hypothetical protein
MLTLVRANPVTRPLSTFEDKLKGSQAHDHHQWSLQGHNFTKEQSQRAIGLHTTALVYSLRSLAHREISKFDSTLLRHDAWRTKVIMSSEFGVPKKSTIDLLFTEICTSTCTSGADSAWALYLFLAVYPKRMYAGTAREY